MKCSTFDANLREWGRLWGQVFTIATLMSFLAVPALAYTQDAPSQERIQLLTQSIDRIEAQLQQSQQELAALKEELRSLRNSTTTGDSAAKPDSSDAATLADAVAAIRESQSIDDAQIATFAQSKVETASKYPLKLSGMILLSGFVNSQRVDSSVTPAVALGGSGSTGATMQQTVLGLDANGPHVLGASSHADLRVDFSGAPVSLGSSLYSSAILRLRTAHAELDWSRTRAFFALDHTILNPEPPTSITAVALPPLAWSGNLWSWNPRVGISGDLARLRSGALRVQGDVTDSADPPPLFASTQTSTYITPSTGELSRWPGLEGRVAYESLDDNGLRLGLGGFYSARRTASSATKFSSWAGTADVRLPLTRYTQLTGNGYFGAALGVLGAGDYKNYVLKNIGGQTYFEVLDNLGGWAQWKQRVSERLEFNEALGIDAVPAHQLRPYAISTPVSYYNLGRNQTATANVIFSPSAYVVLSLEYRHIASSYVTAPTMSSNVIDIAAGYKF